MASGKSSYFRDESLKFFLGLAGSLTVPADLYVALSTAVWSAGATGTSIAGSEPSGGDGYARVTVDNDGTTWDAVASGVSGNLVPIAFATATASWGTIASFYLVDSASGGNVLFGGDLVPPRVIASGDTPRFAPGQLTITES